MSINESEHMGMYQQIPKGNGGNYYIWVLDHHRTQDQQPQHKGFFKGYVEKNNESGYPTGNCLDVLFRRKTFIFALAFSS